jgi:hypothetical protein
MAMGRFYVLLVGAKIGAIVISVFEGQSDHGRLTYGTAMGPYARLRAHRERA